MKNIEIEGAYKTMLEKESISSEHALLLIKELHNVNEGLYSELDNLEKHHTNMSLFIESLFRKSHFDQGRLTLRTKQCNMKKHVIEPQLERYRERFKGAGITIDDRMSMIPPEDVISVVDVGLIAQVFANLFSNALKYTKPVEIFGERKKFVAYGHEVIKDYFGPGNDGGKYNVFSSGPHIAPEDRERIFEEEFRSANAKKIPGTGHGLAFVKNIVELHGGEVGYEPTDYGNNFYIILPK